MGGNTADEAKLISLGTGFAVRQEVDNIAWMVVDDGVLVVDALEQPSLGPEVLRLMAETAGELPVRWVLNTHTHYDHIALNSMFRERFGAEIVNSRERNIPPDGLVFGRGARTVRMLHVPGCHTAEDCIVWVPEDSVLFVGDIFGWGLIPWDAPLDRSKLDGIIQTYEELISFGAETVVPGHGPLCTTADLRRWIEYVNQVVDAARAASGSGKTRREIRSGGIAPPEDMQHWWRFLQWKHEDTVGKITQAVARGKL